MLSFQCLDRSSRTKRKRVLCDRNAQPTCRVPSSSISSLDRRCVGTEPYRDRLPAAFVSEWPAHFRIAMNSSQATDPLLAGSEAAILVPANDVAPPDLSSSKARVALTGCFLVIFANAWLATLMSTPVLRLFEASACRDYYIEHDPSMVNPDGNVAEKFCKIAAVQREVVFLNTSIAVITSTVG